MRNIYAIYLSRKRAREAMETFRDNNLNKIQGVIGVSPLETVIFMKTGRVHFCSGGSWWDLETDEKTLVIKENEVLGDL